MLNTGKDVKIMQGSASSIPISKFSNLEQLATRQIFGVMIFLIALCFTGATAQVSHMASHFHIEYSNLCEILCRPYSTLTIT